MPEGILAFGTDQIKVSALQGRSHGAGRDNKSFGQEGLETKGQNKGDRDRFQCLAELLERVALNLFNSKAAGLVAFVVMCSGCR